MQFVLTGFKHNGGLRVFEFQGIAADKTRSEFFVSADLMLIRRYGIRVQELPLLCLRLLERQEFGEQQHTLIYAEEEMRQHMNLCSAERDAAPRRKPPRRPLTSAGQNSVHVFPGTGSYSMTESVLRAKP